MPGLKRVRASAKKTKGYGVSSVARKKPVARTTPRREIMASTMSKTIQAPFPMKIRTITRYFSGIRTVNGGGAGSPATHVFSANGMYDPDITGVGHQPVGFDQMTPIYDHYTVVGAKICVDFRNDDTTNPYNVYIRCSDSATTLSDAREIVENGYVVWKLLTNAPNTNHTARLIQNVDIAKYLGRKDVLSDPELKGGAGANPTEQVFFHVGAFTLGAVDGGDVSFQATVEFDVIWHERKAVGIS